MQLAAMLNVHFGESVLHRSLAQEKKQSSSQFILRRAARAVDVGTGSGLYKANYWRARVNKLIAKPNSD